MLFSLTSLRCLFLTFIFANVFFGLGIYQYLDMISTKSHFWSEKHAADWVQNVHRQRSHSSEKKLSSLADTGSAVRNKVHSFNTFNADYHNLSATLFDTRNSFLKPNDARNCADKAMHEKDLPICVNDLQRCMTGKCI